MAGMLIFRTGANRNNTAAHVSHFEGTDLLCIRGLRPVFSGLSFALDTGGLLLLTGKNGSGKSSLLRLMAGLLAPAGGAFSWDGETLSPSSDAHQRRLHYIGHRDAVKPALTVSENLRFWSALASGRSDGLTVSRALGDFGLADFADIPARMLSEGQRRRLSLARLSAIPAALWLLDEPTTALDKDSTAAFLTILNRHLQSGGLAVAATHAESDYTGASHLDLDRYAAAARDYWDRVA